MTDLLVADLDAYDPTETAIRWQRLVVEIAKARDAERRWRELNVGLDRFAKESQYVVVSYERERAALDDASTGLSRLTRAARAGQRRAAANLEQLAGRAAELDRQIAAVRSQFDKLGPRPDIEAWQDEADRLAAFLDAVAADAARTFENDPPEWLTDMFGPPPEHPEARGLWRDCANRIQAFRTRWRIDDPNFALGRSLAPDALRSDRQSVASRLGDATRSIALLEHPERGRSHSRAISR